MKATRLAWRSIRHSAGSYVRLGFVAAALGLLVLLINGFGATVESTVSRDFAARSFDRGAALSLGEPLRADDAELLAKTDAVVVIRQRQTYLSALGMAPEADVVGIVAGQPAAPSWIKGRYPQQPGEVSLSSALARQLNVDVGDDVTAEGEGAPSEELSVVGVFPTLSDRASQAAILATPDSTLLPTILVRPDDVAAWLTSHPTAYAVSNWADTSDFTSQPLEIAGTLRSVELVMYFAVAGAVTFATIAFARSRARDIEALEAAGMSGGVAKRIFMWSSVATNLVSFVFGSLLGFGALSLARGPVAGLIGQTWVAIDVSPLRVLVCAVLAVVGTGAVWSTNMWIPSSVSGRRTIAMPDGVAVAGAAAFVGLLLVVWKDPGLFDGQRWSSFRLPFLLLVGALLATFVPRAVEIATQPRGRGLRALVRHQGVSKSITLVSALFVSLVFLMLSAVNFGDYQNSRQPSSVPSEGLVLESVRLSDAKAIAARYKVETGTDAVVLELFPERGSENMFRVAPAAAQDCLEATKSLAICMEEDTDMQLGIPAIASTGVQQTSEWQVSPLLLNGGDKVVLVEFNSADGSVIDATVVPARADDGSFTSVELLGPDVSALAPAGTDVGQMPTYAEVYLPGFARLDSAVQGRVQRANFDIAPYSIAHLAFVPDYALLARAWATVVLGLVITGVLLFRWNDGVWRAHPSVVGAFESQGGASAVRRRLIGGSVATQAVSMGVVLVAAAPLSRNVLHAFSSQFSGALVAYLVATMAVVLIGALVQSKQLQGRRLQGGDVSGGIRS